MAVRASGDPFRRLFDYIVGLHIRWQTYRELFGHSEERIRKLNRRTGFVFRVVQDAMIENIQIEIAKLFDRAKVCGSETLTFEGILKDAPIPVGDPRRNQLEADFKALKAKCDPILTQRHRRLAHNDKAVAMDEQVLPGVTPQMIREIVDGIAKLYSDISLTLHDRQVIFDVLRIDQPVIALLKVLEAGNDEMDAAAAVQREKYKREYGIALPEHVEPPEI